MRQSQRHPNTFETFSCRTDYFKDHFFSSIISEWNRCDLEIPNSGSYNIFCKSLLKFIRLRYNWN